MKEQKNIERLFQEKFKDFEAIPPKDAWDNIASKLNKKKQKKRVIPFWFQLSGIAASLIIIGTLIWNYQSDDVFSAPNNNVVTSEDALKERSRGAVDSNEVITAVDENQNSSSEKNQNHSEENTNQNKIQKLINSENNIVTQLKENKKNKTVGTKFENLNRDKITNSEQNNASNYKNEAVKTNAIASEKFVNKEESPKTNQLVSNENEKTINIKNTNLKENNTIKQRVISDEIRFKDSTLVAEIAEKPNPLEEMLLAKEEGKNEIEKEKINKWAVSTNASPVYFNSLAQGSSLDQEFENNTKNYATTLSYGISGSYSISKKVSIRGGINNINLSYSTNEVLYQAKLDPIAGNNIPTISRNAKGSNMSFASQKNMKNALNGDVENLSQNNLGSLKQNISFVEVPLEITYKILDKKFGIEVIGGMSTLILNTNSISLVTDRMEMEVGKANNLNDIHFSSNVGLGFKYNFLGNFNANFQPMFKYQINTFNANSSNFKPYFIGLYSGISFSF